jgi:DNA-binding transcriptional ArsR family regulator
MTKEIVLDRDAFKALAGETRIQILKELTERRKTQSELAQKLSLSPPTVNEHLELLKKAGLVEPIDEGRKWKYYALTSKGKDLLNPEDTKILLLLGTSVVATTAAALYVFSRFVTGTNELAAAGAPVMEDAVQKSFSQTMTTTAPTVAPLAVDTANSSIPVMAGFTWPELAVLTILVLATGVLIGWYWAHHQQK